MDETTDSAPLDLTAVVLDPLFPGIDQRLRAGVHFGEDDVRAWSFLQRARPWLERFYAGYGCRLQLTPEGYAYLVSEGDLLGHRRLSRAEMLTGQVLALMAMDPAYLARLGRIPVGEVLARLELLVGAESLAERLVGRQRGANRDLDAARVRDAVLKALNGLQRLGFVEWSAAAGEVFPRRAILRFAEPVRESADVEAGLARLVAGQEAEVEAPDEEEDE